MNTSHKALLVLLTCLFFPSLQRASHAEAKYPIVDDAALAQQFVEGLATLVENAPSKTQRTLEAGNALRLLAQTEGSSIRLPNRQEKLTGSTEELYQRAMPAVVVIGSIYKCDSCSKWHLGGMASGWLLSDHGLVVTNHHVFTEEANHYFGAMTSDGNVYAIRTILASDRDGDAAIAQLDTRDVVLPFLRLGQAAACGDPVVVISHPAGRFYSLTRGVVSRYHRHDADPATMAKSDGSVHAPRKHTRDETLQDTPAPVWMSVTADYAVGSSGGPVFDSSGDVVGMVSRTYSTQASKHHRRHDSFGNQMVFKDCVSLDTILGLLENAD
jgi:S1-C subfamily serine protease